MNFSQYKYRAELHCHTNPASLCADLSPAEVIDRYSALGFSTIVLTNHFNANNTDAKKYLKDFRDTRDIGKSRGITVLFGIEISFTENANDYLLYGFGEDFISEAAECFDMGIDRFYKKYASCDRLIIQAHPFRNHMTQVDPCYIDGIEVYNLHPHHNSRVSFAAKYAGEMKASGHDFILTGGTDFHHDSHEGACSILTRELIGNDGELISVLRSRDFLFSIGGRMTALPYFV